jgi:hypothetical protein
MLSKKVVNGRIDKTTVDSSEESENWDWRSDQRLATNIRNRYAFGLAPF